MKKDYEQEKKALLTAFHDNRQALLTCARSWPYDRTEEIFLGSWSVLDLLAHLSGWDEANRAAVSDVQVGKLPEFYAHKDPDWQTFNAMSVRQYRRPSLPQQINQVNQTVGLLEDCLMELDAAAFYKDYGVRYKGWKVIIARLIESELHDERIHLEQMQTWLAGIP
ncbi:MAG: ClbS/DfsB family four-helix bundle protein [Anaerolineaceae bacterium]|nr:ClbS/DfsB family four-helix bundle protein [Anaerolineaceae bacterium]